MKPSESFLLGKTRPSFWKELSFAKKRASYVTKKALFFAKKPSCKKASLFWKELFFAKKRTSSKKEGFLRRKGRVWKEVS